MISGNPAKHRTSETSDLFQKKSDKISDLTPHKTKSTWRQTFRICFVLLFAMMGSGWYLGVGCSGSSDPSQNNDSSVERIATAQKDTLENEWLTLDETSFAAHPDGDKLVVSFVVQRKNGAPVDAVLVAVRLRLATLYRVVHDTVEQNFTLPQNQNRLSVQMTFPTLPADFQLHHVGRYVIDYHVKSGEAALSGFRSLYVMLPTVGINTTGNSSPTVGQPAFLRLTVYEVKTKKPLANAEVQIHAQQERLFIGKTDGEGQLSANIELPKIWGPGVYRFTVKVHTALGIVEEQGVWLLQPVKLDDHQILLTTDKPTYQPGHTIHIRTLAMSGSTRKPIAKQEQTFEISDAKDNKLFKQTVETNAYGVASVSFTLAEELNMGNFKIAVFSNHGSAQKTVIVERYSLPKFEVTWASDTTVLRPGDIFKSEIAAKYFFGKPLSAGNLEINVAEPASQTTLSKISATLDEQGKYQLAYEIPRSFPFSSSSPIITLTFDAKVQDTAKQEVSKSFTLTVSKQQLWIHAVSESRLKVGVENTIFVFATDHAGTRVPLSGEITWNQSALKTPFQTNEHGVAVVRLAIPHLNQNFLPYQIAARDKQDALHETSGHLFLQVGPGNILLQTDRSIVTAGKTVQVNLSAESSVRLLSLDLRQYGKTISSQNTKLEKGKATLAVAIPSDIRGIVQLEAYTIDADAAAGTETKVLYVDGNDSLSVEVSLDKSSYKPAQQAQIQFKVTDAQGKPTQAALGIQVVDEAVFARTEFKPEVARLFFNLTEDLLRLSAQPVGGFRIEDIANGPAPSNKAQEQREWAARLLLPHIQSNPYNLRIKNQNYSERIALEITQEYLSKFSEQIYDDFARWSQSQNHVYVYHSQYRKQFLLWAKTQLPTWIDPWGRPLQMIASEDEYTTPRLTTSGMDETLNTWDDCSVYLASYDWYYRQQNWNTNSNASNNNWRSSGAESGAGSDAGTFSDAGTHNTPDMPTNPINPPSPLDNIRLRQDFPETLKFVPSLITDPSGMASLTLLLADSMTSWRMTTLASSSTGQIGSALTGIQVFQPFFVDMSLPATLTRLDEVDALIAVYNYLPQEQIVQLSLQSDNWFDLLDMPNKSVTLKANEVKSLSFRIRVQKLRQRKLTVLGVAGQNQDGAARSVWIEPNGKRQLASHNGTLDKSVQHKIFFPEGIVPESQQIFVKIYPGVASHLVEGIDSMLQQPHGCFEQTSSITYPNVLVLDYLRSFGKSNPDLENKALSYIRNGYQRLTSYEVKGGGFSWYGESPANIFLTAYGLFQFFDMKKVYAIDDNILLRTQEWLAKEQQPDGSWLAQRGYAHWGRELDRQKFLGTAYVLWSLAVTGYKGNAVTRGTQFLRNALTTHPNRNAYDLALVVNALLVADPTAKEIAEILQKLNDTKTTHKDQCHWTCFDETVMYSQGRYANIETTAITLQAMLKHGGFHATVSCGLSWLQQAKTVYGHWGTTQPTIQTLRTLIQAARQNTAKTGSTIAIKWGNETIQTITIDQTNQDIMQQIDLSHKAIVGENTVSLEWKGIGSVVYQIAGIHYTPWTASPSTGSLTMDIKYDKTTLTVNDVVKVSVSLENTQAIPLQQIVAEVALPPGFVVHDNTLEPWLKQSILNRWERKNGKVVLYFSEIKSNTKLELSFTIQAAIPFKGTVPASRAYLYYNPDVEATTPPFSIEVQP